jgi:hypothetical protein
MRLYISTTWRHRKEFLVFNFAFELASHFFQTKCQRQEIRFVFIGWTEHKLPRFIELFWKIFPFHQLHLRLQIQGQQGIREFA